MTDDQADRIIELLERIARTLDGKAPEKPRREALLTPKAVSERLSMSRATLLGLIHGGKLIAVDCSLPGAKQKTYGITG